ncbi:MAG: integrase core domain-containing protein [Pseudorhodoplanes sp.]
MKPHPLARANSKAQWANARIADVKAEIDRFFGNWRRHYNTVRPHSSLGCRPPAPEAHVWPATTTVAEMPALN